MAGNTVEDMGLLALRVAMRTNKTVHGLQYVTTTVRLYSYVLLLLSEYFRLGDVDCRTRYVSNVRESSIRLRVTCRLLDTAAMVWL
jgi:hypothetical protein